MYHLAEEGLHSLVGRLMDVKKPINDDAGTKAEGERRDHESDDESHNTHSSSITTRFTNDDESDTP